MKTSILILSLSALGLLSSCTYVAPRSPATHSSTTTTSEVSPTTYGTVQTKTTRTY
ncbi:MAG: hypothetical protein V4727_02085 [Verrucomicrobiota bacterium]